MNKKVWIVNISLLVILFISCMMSVSYGTVKIGFVDVLRTLMNHAPSEQVQLVIFQFRLPRVILALMVGLCLGCVGFILQVLTKNPLADPGILGINSGASFGIVMYVFLVGSVDQVSTMSLMPLAGFIGGCIPGILIFVLSYQRGKLHISKVILNGIALSSGFSALILFISLKMNPNDFEAANAWINGSLYRGNWEMVTALLPWLVVILFIFLKIKPLDILHFSDEMSTSLGLNPNKERIHLMIFAIILSCITVSIAGSISFVGLIAPHIAKNLVPPKAGYVLFTSCLLGMIILVISDFVAKNAAAPAEIPLSVVTGLIGIPYFFILFRKSKKGGI